MTDTHKTPERKAILEGQSEQIIQLLQTCYSRNSPKELKTLAHSALIQIIQSTDSSKSTSLIDLVNHQLPAGHAIKPKDHAIILFIEEFFQEYLSRGPLHEQINSSLAGLRKIASCHMLNQPQWPWLSEPNLRASLQLIKQHCIGWSPEFGRASSRFLTKLESMIVELQDAQDITAFNQANRNLNDFFRSETKRINKLEKRLYEAERGALQARHAQKTTARTLNQLMAGKKLPAAISQFLHGPMQKSMQLLLINKIDESQWKQSVDLVDTLIWSVQPIDNNDPRRQHIYQSISTISEKLRDVVISLHHAPHQLDSQLSAIEALHLSVLRNEALSYAPFELINNTDPLSHSQTVISNNLLKQVSTLPEGQWFCFQENDPRRIKLTLKLDEAKQLLFTNFWGVKTHIFSFEEFAYKLSSKAITPISKEDHYQSTGEIFINKLYDTYKNKKQQEAEVYTEQQRKLKEELKAQEAAKTKALKEAKRLAATQQRARIDAENQAKEAEIRQREAVIQQSLQGKITTDTNRLNVGGQVAFYGPNGESRQLKLAVKLQSSGKYVFIDSTGVKRKVILKDDLANMLVEGSAQIVNEGTYFEDSLEKVVNGLRRGRKD
jgi:Protein of unknown function (DUF1631)